MIYVLFLNSSAFPGPPAPPKVVSAFNDCINISWSSPSSTGGSRLLGYILEKRKQGSNLWTCVNAPDEIIKGILIYLLTVSGNGMSVSANEYVCFIISFLFALK